MSKTSIVIIVFCTALLAAAVFFTLREEPGMEDIFLASSKNIEEASPDKIKAEEFSSTESSIYVIIPLRVAKAGETLDIEWTYTGENGYEIIQNDNITVQKEGNGNIAVYLLKRDSSYLPGSYRVTVKYKGSQEKQARFSVTDN